MQTLLRLAKKSAKKIFSSLRDKGPIACPLLEQEIQVTKLFLDHIAFNAHKKRDSNEIIERLLIIPFIEEILQKGDLRQVSNEKGQEFFRISEQFGIDIFTVIVIRQSSGYLLLSCFREY